MTGKRNKHSVRVEFVVTEQEAALIKERMAELGITNLSAYLRKMAVDGYIIHLDMHDIQEMIRLLRICSNNLNQYTRRANETGSVYAADVEDLCARLDGLWDGMEKLLRGFAIMFPRKEAWLMRLVFKILALPFVLVTGILYLVCKFLVITSGAVLGILSGIVFLASLVLFFAAGLWAGLSWLVIAFLISPYGLPMAAAWLTGKIGGINYALRDFIFS